MSNSPAQSNGGKKPSKGTFFLILGIVAAILFVIPVDPMDIITGVLPSELVEGGVSFTSLAIWAWKWYQNKKAKEEEALRQTIDISEKK